METMATPTSIFTQMVGLSGLYGSSMQSANAQAQANASNEALYRMQRAQMASQLNAYGLSSAYLPNQLGNVSQGAPQSQAIYPPTCMPIRPSAAPKPPVAYAAMVVETGDEKKHRLAMEEWSAKADEAKQKADDGVAEMVDHWQDFL
jgi:hypothetical protein